MKLIHISDIHINFESILGSDPVENFRICMDHVERHHRDADMVVITGDLTHHGQRSSYDKLRTMLDGWVMDPVLIIGNHDHRPTFMQVFCEVETDPDGYVQFTRDTSLGRFVFLDTVEEGTHAGHYGEDRQAWLKDQLQQAAFEEKSVWLFLHHHPVNVGVENSDRIGLVDGEAFRTILSEYTNTVRHIFFGHCHYILSGSVCGIPFSAPRSTNHPCVPEFSGENRMGFAPFPPTYNVCLLDEDAVIIHSIDFRDEHKVKWLEATS